METVAGLGAGVGCAGAEYEEDEYDGRDDDEYEERDEEDE